MSHPSGGDGQGVTGQSPVVTLGRGIHGAASTLIVQHCPWPGRGDGGRRSWLLLVERTLQRGREVRPPLLWYQLRSLQKAVSPLHPLRHTQPPTPPSHPHPHPRPRTTHLWGSGSREKGLEPRRERVGARRPCPRLRDRADATLGHRAPV